jgi:hypothetical protein
MKKPYLTSSEASELLGLSKNYIRKYLDPATDINGKPIRIGREFAYYTDDVKRLKKEIENERRKFKEETLNPEDLRPKERKSLAKSAYALRTLRNLGEIISDKTKGYKNQIKEKMKRKNKYTGDDKIVKSIALYPKKKEEVSDKKLVGFLSPEELYNLGIRLKPDVNQLRKKGIPYLKEKLRNFCNGFVDYCRKKGENLYEIDKNDLQKYAKNYLKREGEKQKISLDEKTFLRIVIDLKNNRLGEKKLGKYARDLIEKCIKEKEISQTLRITLTGEFEKRSEELAMDLFKEINFSKLYEISKNLPVD